jgi:hypothetical protein
MNPFTSIGCTGCVSSTENAKPSGVTGTIAIPAIISIATTRKTLPKGAIHIADKKHIVPIMQQTLSNYK